MLFGSDGLANFYLGCFLFGLIFTALSLTLNLGHLGAAHLPGGHAGGHLPSIGHVGHGPHVPTGSYAPAAAGHGPAAGEQVDGLSVFNIPTLMAFLTWFGGAGYIYRTVLGLDALVGGVLAVASGLLGGAIVAFVLTRILWPGQTPPMRRADYYLPGTAARVISGIAAGGTGEIVFYKSGSRRVEGARNETGEPLARGTDVVITRYERGLAYVQPVTVAARLGGLPVAADLPEPPTRPLTAEPAITRDLRNGH